MNKPPTHAPLASGPSRHSVGLSPAHVALIKLLAQRAVEIYLEEVEAHEPAEDREEAAR